VLPRLSAEAFSVGEDKFTVTLARQPATGAMSSITVTVAVQESKLPAASCTRRVIVFAPRFAQVKVRLAAPLIRRDVMPQLSVLPPSTAKAVIVGELRLTVMFLHTATGGTSSTTVTVAGHSSGLPAASSTRRLTIVEGISAQPKVLVGASSINMFVMAQLSVLPPSMAAAATVGALRLTVMFWQTGKGGMSSTTVTVAVQVSELPAASATVSVTTAEGISAQVKVLFALPSISRDVTVQLSVLPPSMAAAATVGEDKKTVMF